MRKFFAIVLAVAMVMSLAAVSFAVDYSNVASIKLDGPYRYDADANLMVAPGEKSEVLRYGEGTYYLIRIADKYDSTNTPPVAPDPVADDADFKAVKSYKQVEKLKVKAEFEQGEALVDSISIVKKYAMATETWNDDTTTPATTRQYDINSHLSGNGYYYFVEFKVASKQTTSEADIVATLEFDRKADDEVKGSNYSAGVTEGIGKIKDVECETEFTVFYKNNWNNDQTNSKVDGDVYLKYDTNYALKFDYDEEVEISFGDNDHDGTNEGTFNVDVSGQGKLFLRYDTKANEAIANANPGAKMFFINFNNVKFNRVGEFTYEMDGLTAAYRVVGDKLVEIKGAEIGADEVTFNTRLLESYVFADTELVNPVVEAPVVEAPVADAVTNPTTGANA